MSASLISGFLGTVFAITSRPTRLCKSLKSVASLILSSETSEKSGVHTRAFRSLNAALLVWIRPVLPMTLPRGFNFSAFCQSLSAQKIIWVFGYLALRTLAAGNKLKASSAENTGSPIAK